MSIVKKTLFSFFICFFICSGNLWEFSFAMKTYKIQAYHPGGIFDINELVSNYGNGRQYTVE